ncbi:hypothetical protein [Methylobacterium aquaticum]|uniref:Uncharacterized protein n=1 Tax=Methylobacterium aquaticum TaxID=270351 RepID=A0A0J6S6T3_9HYPH|nr:hypothetical protein [Methylobacterium aquaticum]KMO29409.1 hypothetical protein VP06_24870 [Methylobacterium aquaticum]
MAKKHSGTHSARRVIDWAGIAAAYRAEPGAGPAIARRFGISPATLRRRARAEGWGRDAPPDAAAPAGIPPSDAPSGEARPGDVLGGHRLVVAQGATLTLRLLDDLQAAIAEESGPEDGAEESGLARAAALQKRVAALRDLAAAARLWIALERQAWDLDGKTDGKGDGKHRDDTAIPDPDAAFRLLDGEQRAQLRAIAERLADRSAGPAAGAGPAR